MTRVLVVDDHAMVRAGLRAVVDAMAEVVLVGEAATGEEALAMVTELRPDLVVMDLHMPGMTGFEATALIRGRPDPPAVLVLTMDEEEAALVAALRAGACGFLVKGASYEQVRAAVLAAAAGELVFGESTAEIVLGALRTVGSADPLVSFGLSQREHEVLTLLERGRSTNEIARALHLSPKTIRNHVSAILTKFGVPDRAGAVQRARQHGFGGR